MNEHEQAMAYADDELDEIAARRFEHRMAQSPDLAEAVRAHRALRDRLQGAFAPVADAPVPERLAGLVQSNVVELRPKARFAGGWRAAAAMAACLVAGVAIGQFWQAPSAGISGDRLMASASLARSLDEQLSGGQGPTRVLVSFRDRRGSYCRLFQAAQIGGIACRDESGWALRRTQANEGEARRDYRQAGSGYPDLLGAAQEMMAGEPLDLAAERSARRDGWRK